MIDTCRFQINTKEGRKEGGREMKVNNELLKELELKLSEYSKRNGMIAEHSSQNVNCNACGTNCTYECTGDCKTGCVGMCYTSSK